MVSPGPQSSMAVPTKLYATDLQLQICLNVIPWALLMPLHIEATIAIIP
jgi:hypothetical protein